MAIVMSSFLACLSYVQLNHLISLVSFCDPHTLFLFFFFCSQKNNKKLWNWVLINLGPVSNCPFSACLYGFVHVCQFVCPCLRLWTCHASFPHIYNIYFLTTFFLAFNVVMAFRSAQTATGWNELFFCLFGWFKVEAVLIFFFNFRLVVSSLEALESCFAVGSSCEKVIL